MATTQPFVRHPIAEVQTLSGGGELAGRTSYVFCARRGETIATDVCAHCPRFIKVVTGTAEEADAVQCLSDATAAAPSVAPLSLARLPVSALMTRNVVCVRPDLSLDAATALFVESGLKAVPVVDAVGKLLGFVSESDVTIEVQAGSASPASRLRTIADVMMPFALAVPESTPVTRAAAVMASEGQQRVAVIGRSGAVVGVLSASDILYWLARSDGLLLPRPRRR